MDPRLKSDGPPKRLGILSGTFHPVTRAHLALAETALAQVDHVSLVMPRQLPHKCYERVSLDQRIALVAKAIAHEPRYSTAVTGGGLFIEIAREFRSLYGEECELWFLCGRDAAERILAWDYGSGPSLDDQLREYGLLVSDRLGRFRAPAHLRRRIRRLPVPHRWTELSATEVRRRIAAGEPWEDLVPPEIIADVRRLYS